METNRANLSSSVETTIQHEPLTTPTLTETTESTLPSNKTPLPPESVTTPMFNNPQRYANENALLKEQIQDLAAEIKAVKMFMKEQMYLLKKTRKDKSDKEEHSQKMLNLYNSYVSKVLPCLRKMRLKLKL